ncbi:MAG: NAD+ synthase, partial [Proteobacteria bacterium]|nr:NAD+ synthase [Pseudomonadota bacterium]
MKENFRLTIAQLNPVLGQFAENCAKAKDAWLFAKKSEADMVALPEMFLTGYQTQDLVLKSAFIKEAEVSIFELAQQCANGPAIGIGHPLSEGGKLYNAYSILENGKIKSSIKKQRLPNYGLFDEKRLFNAGPECGPYSINDVKIGSPICEDAWHPDIAETLLETGAEMLLVPNGSPYSKEKYNTRLNQMVSRVIETGLPLIYLNMVGAQDDQVFDGGSFVLNPGGELAIQLPFFDEHHENIDFGLTKDGWRAKHGLKASQPSEWEKDYRAMVEGLRDYAKKTGFQKCILGMSGGVDSALVATIATDALGAGNVRCVMLPSKFTSKESLDDAQKTSENLGVQLDNIPISDAFDTVLETLNPFFSKTRNDTTEENIQSRLRAVFLMAVSNKFSELLLTTGNKSELASVFSTLYGDMAGGFNPIKDLYKTRVFEICRWRNLNYKEWMLGPKDTVIPDKVIEKEPSAELRENQKDVDSLPPYETLDVILSNLIEQEMSVEELVDLGYDRK